MNYPLAALPEMPIRQAVAVILLDNCIDGGDADLPQAQVDPNDSIYGDYESDHIARHFQQKLVEAANVGVYQIDCDICSTSENAPQEETYLFTRNGECVIARISYPDYCDDESDGFLYALSTPLNDMAAGEVVGSLIKSKIETLQGQIAKCEHQLNKLDAILKAKASQTAPAALVEG